MNTRALSALFIICGVAISTVCSTACSIAWAEELQEVVVTATRTPTAIEQLPTSVTLITREDIERLQVKSLPALLSGIAGVDVTESGGYGKTTGIRIRAMESDHVLVLVDGVRIGSATSGTAAFQHIPVTQIDRVEIVRGPRSSLWGSEALGGIIHIFTRKGSGDTPRYDLHAGVGSFDTYEITAGISGELHHVNYSGAVAYFDSAGIDAREPTAGRFGVDQADKDGYDNMSVHFRGGYDFGEIGEIEAFILHAQGDTEFDGTTEDKAEFTQQIVGGNLALRPLENWTTQLRLGQSQDNSDTLALNGSFSSRFNTQRQQLSWQNDMHLFDPHEVTLGVDYRKDEVESTNVYTQTSRDNLAFYGQYSGNFYGHHILASVRWDDDEIFGSETTGSVGWSYTWNDDLRAYAAYGSAYKTPTFNELFFPGFGNPALGPETADSFEAGIDGNHDGFRWGIRGYRTEIENLIATVANPASASGFLPENVDEARVTGVEGELEFSGEDWQATLVAEYLDPEDKGRGTRLARRVKQRLTVDLKRDVNQFSIAARVLAEGNRFNNAGNRNRVAGFMTLDILAEYRLNRQITLSAKVANLLDKDYQTIDTYNSFDRNFFVTLRYRSR